MLKILVPVDGSRNSIRAVRHLIALAKGHDKVKLDLLNVQERADAPQVRRFMLPREIARLQRAHGKAALRQARATLDRAGVPYSSHVLIGEVAQSIARFAKKRRCDHIMMGTRGMGAIGNLLLGSVATKVIHLAHIPVTLVK